MKLFNLLPILMVVPALVTIEMATMQPGRASPNGCGSGPTWAVTPNNITGASFESACNNHDTCYETLGRSKGSCDTQFYNEMVSACSAKYDTGLRFYGCTKAAGTYHYAVQGSKGRKAYNDAQSQAR